MPKGRALPDRWKMPEMHGNVVKSMPNELESHLMLLLYEEEYFKEQIELLKARIDEIEFEKELMAHVMLAPKSPPKEGQEGARARRSLHSSCLPKLSPPELE